MTVSLTYRGVSYQSSCNHVQASIPDTTYSLQYRGIRYISAPATVQPSKHGDACFADFTHIDGK